MAFYRRNLPHWQPEGAEYFITFRLAGSLPKQAVSRLKQEQRLLINKVEDSSRSADRLSALRERVHKTIFKKYDQLLDCNEIGPTWLLNDEVTEIVKEAIHHRDQEKYDLYAYCIMPNHVHLICKLPDSNHLKPSGKKDYPLTNILKSLKWFTALEANKVLKRTGSAFWQAESYDHVIRDSDELQRIIYYTLQNPVNAGLVDNWKSWHHSYCKKEFRELF
ncbi:transposase [Gracilimonas sediminicola]|uniref:Transposase n=1 Tax=Gracilimonas sediminicola TaxID=2952158 RepID=A0A9X2RGS2_9BACT|nr:transposase [Gracilimonas sediminicola]MCP9291149.1 transposase [Gracilimonas sediminicola]